MIRRRWGTVLLVLLSTLIVAGIGEWVRGVYYERQLDVPSPNTVEMLPRASVLLTDRNFMVRAAACRALSRIGSAAQPAVPALRARLTDAERMVRRDAVLAIRNIGGPDAEAAISEIVPLLNDDHWEVRLTAALALGSFGPKSSVAAERLTELIDDAQMGPWAARAASEVGAGATSAVPRIHSRLKSATGLIRAEYVAALGRFGPAAAVAYKDIEALTADPDSTVSDTAKAALKAIRP